MSTPDAASKEPRVRIPDFRLAYRALEEGDIDKADLFRLLEILESWERGQLRVTCAELLTRQFRVDPSRVRRWESELAGQPSTRVGPYRLRRRVGQGGMGVVYEADHPNLERTVALKILTPGRRDPADIQRFLREVKSAGRFNHPNIVHAYDAGIDGDIPYLAMEYVDGENLFQLLLREGPIDGARALRWLAQATSALWFLEDVGWTHGDGKPSNWVLPASNELKLVDLGLCRPPGKPRDPELIHGSPPYIAPEQLGTGERIDIRSDLFALGATFYHLLAGDPPYLARTVRELYRAQRDETIRPLAELRPDIDPALAAVIDRLLELDPAARYQSCAELADALRRIDGCPAIPPPGSAAAETPSEAPERRRHWVLATVAGVCLIGGALVGHFWLRESDGGDDVAVTPPVATTNETTTADETSAPVSEAETTWHEEWAAALGATPLDYPALYRLLEAHADDPVAGERAIELAARFEDEASVAWKKTARAVEAAQAIGEWRLALDHARAFPERLRLGSYANRAANTEATIEAELAVRSATLEADLRAALERGDVLAAHQRYQRAVGQASSLARHFQEALPEDLRALPWLESIVDAQLEHVAHRRDRVATLREAWQEQRAPDAEWAPRADDVWWEIAAELVRRYPALTAGEGDAWERLYRTGLLAELDREQVALVLALVLGLDVETHAAQLALEKEAADDMARILAECRRWATEPALHAMRSLEEEHLATTAAARDFATCATEWRHRLERGAFLRSDHFPFTVEGEWEERPRMTTDFSVRDQAQTWRWIEDDAALTDGGLAFADTEGVRLVEPMVPLAGSFDLQLDVKLPFGSDWAVVVRYDDAWLAIVHGNAIASANLAEALDPAHGRGAAVLRDEAADSGTYRLAFTFEGATATVRGRSDHRTVELRGAPRSGWPTIYVVGEVTLETARITGTVEPHWLDARRERAGS